MILLSLTVAQAALTPQVLIDRGFAERGYGAVTLSALPSPPLTVPSDEGTVGLEIRLRNRWRVRPHKKISGVYVAEVSTYDDVFGLPTRAVAAESEEKTEPLTWKALAAPGGVEVRMQDLLVLYRISPDRIPWMYRTRTARIRLDRKRVEDPMPLIGAITGARLGKKGQPAEFAPGTFRSLAVATLKHRITLEPDADLRIAFELGAYGFDHASDPQLVSVYHLPNSLRVFAFTNLGKDMPNLIRDTLRRKYGDDPASLPLQRFLEVADPDPNGTVALALEPNGRGAPAIRNRAGDTWITL